MVSTKWSGYVCAPGLFRLILAYLVAIDHATAVEFGPTAVYLFFVLSGYWVHRMWSKEYAPKARPYLVFIVSRFWRLLPVYYVCLALKLATDFVLHNPTSIDPGTGWSLAHFALSQATLLGYATQQPRQIVLYPAWSLDVELQFYFVAPLVIALLAKARSVLAPLAVASFALVGLGLFATVFRDHPQSSFLPMYAIFFVIGVFGSRYDFKPSERVATTSLALAAIATVVLVILPRFGYGPIHGDLGTWIVRYNPVASTIVALLGSVYALATVTRRPAGDPKSAQRDRMFSSLSYDLYLFHVTAIAILTRFNHHDHGRLPGTILMLVSLLPASYVIYRFVDLPIDRMRSRWVKAQPLRAATDARLAVA